MKQAYPIVIKCEKNFYVVFIPDFEINTQAKNVVEAMEMARDAIGMCGCYKEDEGKPIPTASDIATIQHEKGDLLTLVDVDFSDYRKKHENRTIRKNLTVPSWLNEEAEAAGINFSALLQKALKEALQISGK